MTRHRLPSALCGLFAALLVAAPAAAQDVPNFLNNDSPTAPNAQPLSTQEMLWQFKAEGYVVVLRTYIPGLFKGCRIGAELAFADNTRYRCGASFFHVATDPSVLLLRNVANDSHVLLIGGRPVAGRLNEIRGRRLTHAIPLGSKVYGVPKQLITQRRNIGPVDSSSGELVPIAPTRDPSHGPITELSTWPSSMPPAEQSLNPSFRDQGHNGASGAPAGQQ